MPLNNCETYTRREGDGPGSLMQAPNTDTPKYPLPIRESNPGYRFVRAESDSSWMVSKGCG